MSVGERASVRAASPHARGLSDRRGVVAATYNYRGVDYVGLLIGRTGITVPRSEVRRGH